jgi:hypothetical protein
MGGKMPIECCHSLRVVILTLHVAWHMFHITHHTSHVIRHIKRNTTHFARYRDLPSAKVMAGCELVVENACRAAASCVLKRAQVIMLMLLLIVVVMWMVF